MILIVDDEKDLLEIIHEVLRGNGYKSVILCTHPHMALETVKNKKIRLCITDINMPDMNGIELTRQLKKLSPKMTIIAISGHLQDRDEIMGAGADYFMEKPFTTSELLSIIESSIGSPEHAEWLERNPEIEDSRPPTENVTKDIPIKISGKPPKLPTAPTLNLGIDVVGPDFVEMVKIKSITLTGADVIVPHAFYGYNLLQEISIIITLPESRPFTIKINSISQDPYDKTLFHIEFPKLSEEESAKISHYLANKDKK